MKKALLNRRRRMITLLSLHNSVQSIVETLSKEFNCKLKTIYADYERRESWIPQVEAMEGYAVLMNARLDFLDREAVSMVLAAIKEESDVKNKFVKIGAINTALKITQEQIRLAQERGYIDKRPIEIVQNTLSMPFTVDPLVRKALEASAAAQQQQRQLRDEQRQKDAPEHNEAQANSGN